MLIPIHKLPYPGACKRKGRAQAVHVADAIVDDNCAFLAVFFWTLSDGYAVTRVKGKTVFMHHLVVDKVDGLDVSHENGNPLDNRRCNLLNCSRSVNMLNPADGPTMRNQSSGLRGVTRDDRGRNLAKPWRGKIQVNGRTHQTRRYATAEEAAQALNKLRSDLRVRQFPAMDGPQTEATT